MRKSKTILSVIVAAMMIATMVLPVSAEAIQKIDYTVHKSAELDPDNISLQGIFGRDYNVYSDAWWIIVNGVGVGAAGWTNLTSKEDGTYIWHYSNIVVHVDDYISKESGRRWGSGKVEVSTGNLGYGACSSYNLYYGITDD